MMEAYRFANEAEAYAFAAGIQLAGIPEMEVVGLSHHKGGLYVIVLNDIDGNYDHNADTGVVVSTVKVPRLTTIAWDEIEDEIFYTEEEVAALDQPFDM
jgi:hypothetical protein